MKNNIPHATSPNNRRAIGAVFFKYRRTVALLLRWLSFHEERTICRPLLSLQHTGKSSLWVRYTFCSGETLVVTDTLCFLHPPP